MLRRHLKKIFGWIRRDLGADGFKRLNKIVSGGMRAWMAKTGDKFATGSLDTDRLASVGQLLHNLARFKEAEPLYRRALAIDEAAHGPDHPNVATMLCNLAGLLEGQAKYEESEVLYRRALAIYEAARGPDHQGHYAVQLGEFTQGSGQVRGI